MLNNDCGCIEKTCNSDCGAGVSFLDVFSMIIQRNIRFPITSFFQKYLRSSEIHLNILMSFNISAEFELWKTSIIIEKPEMALSLIIIVNYYDFQFLAIGVLGPLAVDTIFQVVVDLGIGQKQENVLINVMTFQT